METFRLMKSLDIHCIYPPSSGSTLVFTGPMLISGFNKQRFCQSKRIDTLNIRRSPSFIVMSDFQRGKRNVRAHLRMQVRLFRKCFDGGFRPWPTFRRCQAGVNTLIHQCSPPGNTPLTALSVVLFPLLPSLVRLSCFRRNITSAT